MAGDYALTVKFYDNDEVFKKTSTLSLAAPPVLIGSTLTCNVPQLQKTLQSTLASVLDGTKLSQVYSVLERQIEGTEISGSVEYNPGIPRGSVRAYLIRYPRHRSYPNFVPCKSHYKSNVIEFGCLPSIEDVGLVIMAFNALNSSHTTDQAEVHLKEWIIRRFAPWLLKIPPTNLKLFSRDLGADYRVTPLKIGWPAVVHIGQKIRMFCPLDVLVSPDGIECKKTKSLGSISAEPLPVGFWIEAKSGQKFFNLRKNAAELTDSGIYECTVKVGAVRLQVCTDRRLTVIADSINVQTFIYDKVVPAKAIKVGDVHNQYTESLDPYFMTKQVGYIVCWTTTEVGFNFSMSLSLTREEPKPRWDFPFKLVRTLNLREGMHRMQKFKFYQCGGYGKAEYGGKLKATCSVTSKAEKKDVPAWIKDENDLKDNFELGHIASNTRDILVFHAVEGDLSFYGSVRHLQEYPVPLGTSIRCTGAKGFPPPTYQWTKVDPSRLLSLNSSTYFNLAGTPNVFLDSPDAFPNSAFQGDRLEVPNDARYRGMSFLFQCSAFNELVGKTYRIERLLFLTICLCEHRFVSLDLSLIYSPQMVAGHTLLDPHDAESSLDFYGQRYVHLLQQIILGLAHGADYVRISTNPTTILNKVLKRASLYAGPKSLTHGLSRFQLAEGLFSKSVRPQPIYHANNDSCPRKIPVDLTEGFLSVDKNVLNTREDGLQVHRPHAVVLPQDRWDKGDVAGFMRLMKMKYVHVISVYFASPSGWAKGSPDCSVQLTNGDVFGEKCSDHSTKHQATFIKRLPLFDAICNLSQPADVYNKSFVGFGFLSHLRSFMFEGESITFFTVIRVSPFDKEQRHLRVCFIDQTAAASIIKGFENQKYFDSKCKKVLADSASSGSGSTCLSMSRSIKLDASLDGDAILAYERGVDTILLLISNEFVSLHVGVCLFFLVCLKKLHVLVIFSLKKRIISKNSQSGSITIDIRLNQGGLKAPYLLINQLAQKANDSAEFECVIEMTRINYQIDLVYWSNRGGNVNTTTPCRFTTWENGGCGSSSNTHLTTHPKAAFAKCSLSYVPKGNVYNRAIEYTIPLVTIKHFDAFVFCETLPSWEMDEDNRLLSDPIDNLFPVKPTLTNINIGYYEWICEVIAYPPPTNFNWRIKEAHPWNFRLGLNRISFYKNPVNSTRASILSKSKPGFFPKKFIPKEETSPYYFALSRAAPSFWQVGAWGVAKLECEVSNGGNDSAVKEAHVNYASGNSNGRWAVPGSLYPRLGMINISEPWAIECPIMENKDSKEIHSLYVLGKVTFAAEPIELPLFHVSFQMQKEGSKAYYFIQHFKPIGWWSSIPLDEFKVESVDDNQGHKAVRIQISRALVSLAIYAEFNDKTNC
ncbi:hypothetical protein EGR_06464 [Echinococcus granulosus]|uniref:Ig-like domain-containing protein n=1 Tax=Echinococcus granulosus TaxID=6210 RepID=W6UBB8_ECHGR|nr:hypothetical protein EGR_06464 [Echinococcus granulosus]EUB58678.1 hypothetical protein EGR_06464 [Echinococcus granulosus]